jgi:hypothetical protein
MKSIKDIENKVHKLPSNLLEEVDDYIDFLIFKKQKKEYKGKKLKQKWAGALKQYNREYTSVQLQKQAMQWRKK